MPNPLLGFDIELANGRLGDVALDSDGDKEVGEGIGLVLFRRRELRRGEGTYMDVVSSSSNTKSTEWRFFFIGSAS